MNPATLSIITATFPPRQRGMAIGIWAGVSAMALAIGPLVGRAHHPALGWSWIFFINVPIGILAIIVTRLVVDESRDTSGEPAARPSRASDARGSRLFALTYGLIEANTYGWTILAHPRRSSPWPSIAFAAFILLEMHQRAPMLDLSLFKNGTFAGANTVMLLVGLAMFGVFFYNSLFIQNVLGCSAVQTGASFLPMTVLIILVAPIAGKYSDRVGSRWLVGGGMVLLSISLLSLLAARRDLELLGCPPGAPHRRLRHGDRDDADHRCRHGLRAGGQGGRRLGGPEQHAPGRRLARNRRHGRDHRRLRDRRAGDARGRRRLRHRLPARAPGGRGHRPRRRDPLRRHGSEVPARVEEPILEGA